MAARILKPRHQDDIRAKIQASNIITRLYKHLNGEVEMSATQIKASEILLKKSLPDLSSVEMKGPDGGAIPVSLIQLAPLK